MDWWFEIDLIRHKPFENIHGEVTYLSFVGNKQSPNNGQDQDVELLRIEDWNAEVLNWVACFLCPVQLAAVCGIECPQCNPNLSQEMPNSKYLVSLFQITPPLLDKWPTHNLNDLSNRIFSGFAYIVCILQNSQLDSGHDRTDRPTGNLTGVSVRSPDQSKQFSWSDRPNCVRLRALSYWLILI